MKNSREALIVLFSRPINALRNFCENVNVDAKCSEQQHKKKNEARPKHHNAAITTPLYLSLWGDSAAKKSHEVDKKNG